MLSAAKHLSPCGGETLRCAQSDSLCCQFLSRTPCRWAACAKTETVMLSAAKHLSPCGGETLRCAQSDSLCCQFLSRTPCRWAACAKTETVMLSAAKHLSPCGGETLRCAQSDSLCCQFLSRTPCRWAACAKTDSEQNPMPLGGMRKDRNCHAERSEASQPMRGRDPFAALRAGSSLRSE